MKDIDRLQKTEELANTSSFVKINGRIIKVGSSIYKGNRFISRAVNENKTHTAVVRYNDVLPFTKEPFLHAEMSALIKASKIIDEREFKDCTLYVARKLNCGGYGLARPCRACMEAIKEFGINKIVYTTDSGYAIEFIRDDE